MNNAMVRRFSWLSVIVAAALSIALPQSLVAQPDTFRPGPVPAASGQLKTFAVLAGAHYEKLISDISFLGTLIGKPESGQMAEGIVAKFTMGKGAGAIDKAKPWGIIVQTDGMGFYPVACLPITKPDDVLDVAKAYGAEVKDGENGTKELTLPNQRSFFVKSEKDVVFISQVAASLTRLPANAPELLKKMVAEYDLSAAVSVKNIPDMYRHIGIGAMQAGLQQGMKKLPEETDEQFADRQHMTEAQIKQFTQMLNEIDSIKVGWGIDSQKKRTYADFTYQFLSGSKMAQRVAAYGQAHTDFAGFYQPDAAATMAFATKADPKMIAEDLAQFEAMMRKVRQQSDREIDKNEKIGDPAIRESLKAAANDLFDAIESTIKEGHLDGAASLHASPNSLTFIAGLHVKEPAKLEDALKKLEATAKKSPEFPGINWNAANHAGVNFHTIKVPVPVKLAAPNDNDGPRKMLGDSLDVAIGIGPDAVYLAVGKDNISEVSKAMDASASNKGKAIPPFEFALSLGPILEVAADASNGAETEKLRMIADMLKNQAQGQDHIRAVGQPVPNGLRYRIEAEEGVLRVIGAAGVGLQERRRQGN